MAAQILGSKKKGINLLKILKGTYGQRAEVKRTGHRSFRFKYCETIFNLTRNVQILKCTAPKRGVLLQLILDLQHPTGEISTPFFL